MEVNLPNLDYNCQEKKYGYCRLAVDCVVHTDQLMLVSSLCWMLDIYGNLLLAPGVSAPSSSVCAQPIKINTLYIYEHNVNGFYLILTKIILSTFGCYLQGKFMLDRLGLGNPFSICRPERLVALIIFRVGGGEGGRKERK